MKGIQRMISCEKKMLLTNRFPSRRERLKIDNILKPVSWLPTCQEIYKADINFDGWNGVVNLIHLKSRHLSIPMLEGVDIDKRFPCQVNDKSI